MKISKLNNNSEDLELSVFESVADEISSESLKLLSKLFSSLYLTLESKFFLPKKNRYKR